MPTSNQCIECANYWGAQKCKAFPKGIPEEIVTGDFVHTEKHPEQSNDVLYKAAAFVAEAKK